MAIYECNGCGTSEVFDRVEPACCSVCGGGLSLISGNVVDLAAIEAVNFEAAATAYLEDAVIQRAERRRAAFACSSLLLLAALILASMALRSDAMATCQQAHSFDTCFSVFNR